jgi:hypothetical protein
LNLKEKWEFYFKKNRLNILFHYPKSYAEILSNMTITDAIQEEDCAQNRIIYGEHKGKEVCICSYWNGPNIYLEGKEIDSNLDYNQYQIFQNEFENFFYYFPVRKIGYEDFYTHWRFNIISIDGAEWEEEFDEIKRSKLALKRNRKKSYKKISTISC